MQNVVSSLFVLLANTQFLSFDWLDQMPEAEVLMSLAVYECLSLRIHICLNVGDRSCRVCQAC